MDRLGYALGYIEYHEQAAWMIYKLTREEAITKAAQLTPIWKSGKLFGSIGKLTNDFLPPAGDTGSGFFRFIVQYIAGLVRDSMVSDKAPEIGRTEHPWTNGRTIEVEINYSDKESSGLAANDFRVTIR